MKRRAKAKKQIAVIGYGSQGRAVALNLRDSGYPVLVGLPVRSKSRGSTRKDRITVKTVPEAVAAAEIVIMAFPDHLHGRVFARQIGPSLQPGATLLFLHGMSVHFGFVQPPERCDVVLLAPHAPGLAVREKYLAGERSISAFVAVHQNRSRRARQTLMELAKALGFDTKRLIATTFADEAIGDLFGEQAVLCGGLAMLIKSGFETLVEHGLKPDHAYLEVAYQLDLIIALVKRYGIEGMLKRISVAARFGSLSAGPRVIDGSIKKRMRAVLAEIVSGKFPRQLDALDDAAIRRLNKSLGQLSNPKLEKAAKKFGG